MSEQKNIVAFLDSMERTIIGERKDENGEVLKIQNPVVVNIVPQGDPQTGQPTGQMALQLLPVFFKEFLGDKDEPVIYNYQKSRITQINFNSGFDFRLYAQYERIFNSNAETSQIPGQVPQTNTQSDGPVVELFKD